MKWYLTILTTLTFAPSAWAGFAYCVGRAADAPNTFYVSPSTYQMGSEAARTARTFRERMENLGQPVSDVRCVDGDALAYSTVRAKRAEVIADLEAAGRRVLSAGDEKLIPHAVFCYGAGVSERRGYVSDVVNAEAPLNRVANLMRAYLSRRDLVVPDVNCVSSDYESTDIYLLRARYLRRLRNTGAEIVDVPNFLNQ